MSEEYNTLIDKAFKATDKDERSEFLRQAEKVLMDSACIVPLVFNQNFAFVSKELSKVKNDGFGNFVLTKTKQKNYEDYLD